jgi:hypothetical protein
VTRLPLQGVARYTRENADRGEEVAILKMLCSGGEPAKFVCKLLGSSIGKYLFFLLNYSK